MGLIGLALGAKCAHFEPIDGRREAEKRAAKGRRRRDSINRRRGVRRS